MNDLASERGFLDSSRPNHLRFLPEAPIGQLKPIIQAMPKTRHRHPCVPVLLAGMLLLLSSARGSAQQMRYWFEAPQTLQLDAGRLALEIPDLEEATESLRALGVNVSDLRPWPIPNWYLLTRKPQATRSPQQAVARLAASPAIACASPVFLGLTGGPMWPTRHLIVQGNENLSRQALKTLISEDGRSSVLESDWGGLPRCVYVDAGLADGFAILARANALAADPRTRFAEPDWVFTGRKDSIPTDQYFNEQWYLDYPLPGELLASDMDTDAPEAWDISMGRHAVKIAIVDDGIQMDHPDLPRDIRGYDATGVVGGGGAPQVTWDNHGTVVAGIIAGTRNNGRGVSGLVPDVEILSVRVYVSFSYYGFTSMTSWTVPGLDWCLQEGVQITNNSVTLGLMDSALTAKYDQLRQAGILHYASAGNDPVAGTSWPANLASVHGVTGIDFTGSVAGFSSFGPNMDYCAGAQFIYSTDRTGMLGFDPTLTYAALSGTTFSCAYGSAHGAMALSVNPSLTADQVDDILALSCMDLGAPGFDPVYSQGLLNAYAVAWQAALTLQDPSTVLFRQDAPLSEDLYGTALAGLGDVDGDGIEDFAVGVPSDDQGGLDAGAVVVRSGKSGQILYQVTGAAAGDRLGAHLFSLGDLNGDGIRDFAVTDPNASLGPISGAGKVTILSGSDGAQLFQVTGSTANERFGSSVLDLGDLNADGVPDVAIGAPRATVGGTLGIGRVRILSGADLSLILNINGNASVGDAEFGSSLSLADDFDGDGLSDLLVGIPGAATLGPDTGRARLISTSDGSVLITMEGLESGARLGQSVAAWIDADNDGIQDFVAAAPASAGLTGSNTGSAVIYSGADGSPFGGWVGENAGDLFGAFLATSDDVDGDGSPNLLVGVPGSDAWATDAGAIHVYSRFWPRPRYVLHGGKAHERFGASAAPLGDVDGDGLGEIVVGAPGTQGFNLTGWTAILPAPNPNQLTTLATSAAGHLATSQGDIYDVLLVNNSSGGLDRTVNLGLNEAVRLTVLQPVGMTTPANFAVWAYLGAPPPTAEVTLAFGIGDFLFQPCTVGGPNNVLITNNFGPDACPELVPSTPGDWTVMDPGGLPLPFTLTYQGVILDGPASASATNAVKLVIQ
ncbi:MAG TPA: hypothetical protein ENK43_10875 [Planctomycetes bacterium]|nr:hypothetical protein [Planctomycetota bacterium]